MPDKAWKKRERDVAGYFKGTRTPLSGGNGKITRADVIHESLFIECKLRAKHTVVSLWDDTAKLAKSEGKTPVIALLIKLLYVPHIIDVFLSIFFSSGDI